MANQPTIYFVNSHSYIEDEIIKIPNGTIFVSITGICEPGRVTTCLSSHILTEEKLFKAFRNIRERKKLEEELKSFLIETYGTDPEQLETIKINIYTEVAPEAVFELSNHTKGAEVGEMLFWPGGIYDIEENTTLYKQSVLPQGIPKEGLKWWSQMKFFDLKELDESDSGQQITLLQNLDPTRETHYNFMQYIIDYVIFPSKNPFFKELLFKRLYNWRQSFQKWKHIYAQEKIKEPTKAKEYKQNIEQKLNNAVKFYTEKLIDSTDEKDKKYFTLELNNAKTILSKLKDKNDTDYVIHYILEFMTILEFIQDKSYQDYVKNGEGFYYFNHLCMIKLSDILQIRGYSSNSIILGLGCRGALPIFHEYDTNVSKIVKDEKYKYYLKFQEESQRDDKIELNQVACNEINCSGPINKLLFANNTGKILNPNDFCKETGCAVCSIQTEKREGYNLLDANRCISCETAKAIVFDSSKNDFKSYCFTKEEIYGKIKFVRKDTNLEELTKITHDSLGIIIPYEVIIGTLLFYRNIEQMPNNCWEFLVERIINYKEDEKKKKNESMLISDSDSDSDDNDMEVVSDNDDDSNDMAVDISTDIDDTFYKYIINGCIKPFDYLTEDQRYPELIKFYTNNFRMISPEHQELFIKLLIDNVLIPQSKDIEMFTQKCNQYFLIYNSQEIPRIIYAIYKHLEEKNIPEYLEFFNNYLFSLPIQERVEFIQLFSLFLLSISQNINQFANECQKYLLNENIGNTSMITQIILDYLKPQVNPVQLEEIEGYFYQIRVNNS